MSFTATEVATYGFCVQIAPRLAAAKWVFRRIAGRRAPRFLAMAAYHRRTKTRDRILGRDERQVFVIGSVSLCTLPREGPGRKTRLRPGRCRGDQEQRPETQSKEAKSRSNLDDE